MAITTAPRYTSLSFFAVAAAPGAFLRQTGPSLGFVLSATQHIASMLAVTKAANLSLSAAPDIVLALPAADEMNVSLSVTGAGEPLVFELGV